MVYGARHRETKHFGRRQEALPYHHSPPAAAHSVTRARHRTIPPPPAAEPPTITVELSAAEPPSNTLAQSQSAKNTIKKGRHNVTTLYIKYELMSVAEAADGKPVVLVVVVPVHVGVVIVQVAVVRVVAVTLVL